jgi:hypothetical protein
MKKITELFLAVVVSGGLQVFAEDDALSADTIGANTQPVAKSKKTSAKPKTNFKNNIFYGGYINLSFGSYKVIGIEPMIGYKLTPKFAAGLKLRYDYIEDDRYAQSYTTSTYGGSIFGRYLLTPKFYAQVEAATYNYEYFYFNGGSEREWVPFLLMGGGLIQPLGEHSWMNVQIMFDVWQDDSSPYDDWQPFFSLGIGTGF